MGNNSEMQKEQMQREKPTKSDISVEKEQLTPTQISRAVAPVKEAWEEVGGCLVVALSLEC